MDKFSRRGILFLLLQFALSACVSPSTVIPLQGSSATYEALPTESVGIYRTHGPYQNYREIGLIAYHSPMLSLPYIYQNIRRDAAARGANAVIDFKIKGETHREAEQVEKCEPHTECGSDGQCETKDICHWETEYHEVSSYLGEGTMIRSQQ